MELAVAMADHNAEHAAPFTARRILIYGVTGSGKSTLAARLSEITRIEWHEADALTWEPNWVQVGDDLQRERISEVCRGESWILDTAYAKWVDIPLAHAELIIGLDYPRWLSFARLVRRSIARAHDQLPVCNGNHEKWRTLFSHDSILLWHFKSFSRKRARLAKWAAAGDATPQTLIVQRPNELERLLQEFARHYQPTGSWAERH